MRLPSCFQKKNILYSSPHPKKTKLNHLDCFNCETKLTPDGT